MPSPIALGVTFVESFFLYSFFRNYDVKSTARLAKRMDLKSHEVNPLLTYLSRKWGLENAFRITWLPIASGIAVADTFLNIALAWGIPAIALLFGTTHLLAAASNDELEYRTRGMSRDEIEAETFRFAEELSRLGWKGRLSLLTQRFEFSFATAAISASIIFLIGFSNQVGSITHVANSGTVMTNIGIVEVAALLLFFPAIFLGQLVWSQRLVKLYRKGQLESSHSDHGYIEIPVTIAEEAIGIAKAQNAVSIRLQLKSGEGGESGGYER